MDLGSFAHLGRHVDRTPVPLHAANDRLGDSSAVAIHRPNIETLALVGHEHIDPLLGHLRVDRDAVGSRMLGGVTFVPCPSVERRG